MTQLVERIGCGSRQTISAAGSLRSADSRSRTGWSGAASGSATTAAGASSAAHWRNQGSSIVAAIAIGHQTAGCPSQTPRPLIGDDLARCMQAAPDRAMRLAVLLRRIVPFALINLLAFSIFLVRFSWWLPLISIGVYLFLMVGSAGWMHRYFSHRSFKTSRWFQFVMAFWGGCAAERGTLWWAAHHRRHHAFSETEDDPHSPIVRSFMKAHFAWIFEDQFQEYNEKWVRDLARYPELVFLDRWYWLAPICLWTAMGLIGYLIGSCSAASSRSEAIQTALAVVAWGPILGTVLSWQASFCINSVTHLWGRRDYETGDHSRNNAWLSLINLGEGWHNNHHYYPHSANSGFRWWQFDPLYYLILCLEKTGLIWEVKRAPQKVIEGHTKSSTPRPESVALRRKQLFDHWW